MVGETGTGKTAVVQEVSKIFGKKLQVFNISHSTDSSDLFGGFRPIDEATMFKYFIEDIEKVVSQRLNPQKNKDFINNLKLLWTEKKFVVLSKFIMQACQSLKSKLSDLDTSRIDTINKQCLLFLSKKNTHK